MSATPTAELLVDEPEAVFIPEPGMLLTAEEFAQLRSDDVRHDLIEGAVVEMPRPKPEHARVVSRLMKPLFFYLEDQQIGEIFTEAGFLLARNPDIVRGPDIAFIASERLTPDVDLARFFPGAPDLVVEVVSTNDLAFDLREKVDLYLQTGARLVWVVYPALKVVDVYRTDGSAAVLRANDGLDGEGVLPGFTLPLAALFG